MTLTELKTLIQNYVENDETTFVSTLDDIIKNAEERIFELVQFDFFKKNVSGNVTLGNRFLTAPSDYILSTYLAVVDGSGDYTYLEKKHSSFMQEYTVDPTDSSLRGKPLYYADYDKELSTASSNGSTLVLAPVPDSNYTVELQYIYKPASLVSSTTGTWLSQNARNGLLFACLSEAYLFMKGDAQLQEQYERRFQEEISRLKNRAEGRGRRDEYRYDSLRSQTT
tara:strand:+ start:1549 stop:2223 length:675 start_codon:yes stop_codon:yes gene_type:complete